IILLSRSPNMSWTRDRPSGGPSTTSASATMTATNTPTNTSNIPLGLLESGTATLILRAERDANDRRVTWSDDVIDNEGLGRKSSKGMLTVALLGESKRDRPSTNTLSS